MPKIIKVANKFRMYDEPTDRKIHPQSISSLGGIGIYFSLVLGMFSYRLVNVNQHFDPSFYYVLFGMTVIFLNGLGDDLFGFSANQKFFVQFVLCFAFIDTNGIIPQFLQDIIGSYWVSRIIISFALVAIINSINLIDGIDGLAGSLGLVISLVFFCLNLLYGNSALAGLSIVLAGSLLGFLFYNFSSARIFMGDSGSLLLGFIIALLTISTPYKNLSISLANSKLHVINIILATISLPLFEVVRLFFSRLIAGKSPFNGDRNHLHHLLVDSGVSTVKSVISILLMASFLIIESIVFANLYWYKLLPILMLTYLLFIKVIRSFVSEQNKSLSDYFKNFTNIFLNDD
jgi:UDP-N-acetylmuramyl pentapeptide phosphotransferase/UDP-N-acetylglucosamine-1-phosphate transferase